MDVANRDHPEPLELPMTAVLAYPQTTSYAARRMREAVAGTRPTPTPIREFHAWPPSTFATRPRAIAAPVTTLVVHELAAAVEAIAEAPVWPLEAAPAPLAIAAAVDAADARPAPVMTMDALEELTTVAVKTLGIYRLTPAVVTTSGRDAWAARCLTHPLNVATTPTMKSARVWLDEHGSWCPECMAAGLVG